MTDLDAIGYLKQLQHYNQSGQLHTPQNLGPDTIWSCAFDHAIRALRERAGIPENALSFVRNKNGSISVSLDQTIMDQREPDGPWTNIRICYDFIGYAFETKLRVKAWRDTPQEDIAACVKNAVMNQNPDNVSTLIRNACKKQDWLCVILDQNAAGFPADLVLTV